MNCSFFIKIFFLLLEIRDFSHRTQQQIFDDILDQQVQQELEIDNRIINWNSEVTTRFHSRLYALWNRKNGDCLLDSVLTSLFGSMGYRKYTTSSNGGMFTKWFK